MDWDSHIVQGIFFGGIIAVFFTGWLVERIHRRQVVMQRYLRETQRILGHVEIHLRLLAPTDESEQQRKAILRAHDYIDKAFTADLKDQKFGLSSDLDEDPREDT